MLRDLATGTERRLPTPEMQWTSIDWSNDGKRLLLIRSDGYLVEIDASTGHELRRVMGGAEVYSGGTYVGDEIMIGRSRWTGDLWTATIE